MSNYQKVYMNQIHSSSLLCQLAQMWKSQMLCDAIIRTGQIITKAHRVVLVAACPMLQSMENASAGSHLEVRLAADIKQESVNTFLQYLYEGFMMLTEDNCRDVEKIARLLQVDGVTKCCADFYKCIQAKTGAPFPGPQCKYSFNDMIEFRHVRTTDLQKTVQDRLFKRAAEFSKPGSPGVKRQKMQRGASPDITILGADKADDTASMVHSYMTPDPWDRVPRLGSGTSKGGKSSQPGVIDIVEESLELVQTEPPEKDSGQPGSSDSQAQQKSGISIAVASQYNTDPEISVVNVTGDKESGSSSQTNVTATNASRGSITVSPLTIFPDSQRTAPSPVTNKDNIGQSVTSSQYSEPLETVFPEPQKVVTSTPRPSNQPKPFAAGSASQANLSSANTPTGSPSSSKTHRPPPPMTSGRMEVSSPADRVRDHSKVKSVPSPSISDGHTPDLSIVKVERTAIDDTGGLDMHVDMGEDGMMSIHRGRLPQDDQEGAEPSDAEIEDWAREEMSNEGSNVSGDQNNSWYMGTFKGYYQNLDYEQQTQILSCLNILTSGLQAYTNGCPEVKPNVTSLTVNETLNQQDLTNQQGGSVQQQQHNPAVQERKLPLLQDQNNSFDDVLVNPSKLRSAEMKARMTSRNPGVVLLNKVVDLIFSPEELIEAKGVKSLDQHKMEAVKEYMFARCKSLGIDQVHPRTMVTTIQNKMGNLRYRQAKSVPPKAKAKQKKNC